MAKLPSDLNHIISNIKAKSFAGSDSTSSKKHNKDSSVEAKTGVSQQSSRSQHKPIKFVKPQQQQSNHSPKHSNSKVGSPS
jgi:hypothetical protein